jgi:riboflavin kinase/FMN adenylyltransferase
LNILTSLDQLPKGVSLGVTLGNFDGVHLGHQDLLRRVKVDCTSTGMKLLVITFVPHPRLILGMESEKFMLTSFESRREFLSQMGVDYLLEISFTRDVSTMNAPEFFHHFMTQYVTPRKIYLGYDFSLGAHKQGNHEVIKDFFAEKYPSVAVEVQPVYSLNNSIISSSVLRDKITKGNVHEAISLLGRPFKLAGIVVRGDGRGKSLGFPTANLLTDTKMAIPGTGIYATKTLYNSKEFYSITNIGVKPTFGGTTEVHIETNIFDFFDMIYGEKIEVSFYKKLRDEKKFLSLEELVKQISLDILQAKEYFLPPAP